MNICLRHLHLSLPIKPGDAAQFTSYPPESFEVLIEPLSTQSYACLKVIFPAVPFFLNEGYKASEEKL
jgi:hypothetical protein